MRRQEREEIETPDSAEGFEGAILGRSMILLKADYCQIRLSCGKKNTPVTNNQNYES